MVNDEPKVNLKVRLDNIFQYVNDKVTSWSQTPSNDKYPSEKLVKDSLDEKISKSNISGLIKNDGTVDTNIYISASDECGTFTELKTLIDNAQTGDIVVLEKDYKNTGNEDFPRINKVIKIIGNGHIIDGNNVNRIFNVNVDGIIFENIVFINGSNNALYGRKMNIFDCVFINNFEYYDGGAVCCDYDVNIVNSTFINNKVETDDWNSCGGAIWIGGNNSVIQDCLFIGNSASATGYDGLGGAIYIDGNQNQSKILDCTFIDNSASSNGGGIYSSTQNFKVYNCTLENSSLYNTTNVNYLTEHQSLKTINNESLIGTGNIEIKVGDDYGTFTELQELLDNTYNGTLNLDKDYQCQNGENPIYSYNDININGNGHIIDGNNISHFELNGGNLYNIKFINCHSDYNGGAVYSFQKIQIDNCLFMNNTSGGNGGVLDFESDNDIVTNCIFINNKSQGDGGVLYSECEGYKFINCIFSNNSSNYNGGALWVAPYEDEITIKDCVFVDNTATGDGGGIYAYSNGETKVYNCTFIESSLYNVTNIDYITEHQNINGKEDKTNKINVITDSSTDIEYPSAKSVYDFVSALSGGGGISDFYIDTTTDEIVIEADGSGGGGGSVDIITEWEQTLSDEKVPSEKLTKLSIDDKANINHTHTKSQITDFPTIPNKVSDLNNDSGFITSSSLPTKTSDLTNDGDGTNVFVKNNDSRLSDARTPTVHNHDDRYYTETEIENLLDDKISKSQTNGLIKNDGSVDTNTYLTQHQDISGKLNISQTSYKGKNVVVDSSSGNITFEDKPTVPSASSTTPSADTTNGSVGDGTTWARSNHTHPKSSLYAESSHNHNYSNINNVTVVDVVVTYTDNTTETIKLLKYNGS